MLCLGVAAMVLGGCATGSTSQRPIASASAASESPTTAQATGTASASEYPQAARVIADELEVRTGPGTEHPLLERGEADMGVAFMVPVELRADAVVLVLEPVTVVDGEQWTHVALTHTFYDTHVYVGWISGGSGDAPSIGPIDSSWCPTVEEGYLVEAPPPFGLLVVPCFDLRRISIEGELQAAPSGTACSPAEWMTCENLTMNGMPVHLDPISDLIMPAAGSVVTISGHFNDPRASTCGGRDLLDEERTAAILSCRTAFVIDEVVSPPIPRAGMGSPAPVVEFVGTETYDDGRWTRYRLRITNWDEYPTGLLAAAPNLEGCGGFEVAARTWVSIHAATGQELELYCAADASEDPAWLSFARRTAEDPPPQVYVEMLDRVEDVLYRSDPVPLGP